MVSHPDPTVEEPDQVNQGGDRDEDWKPAGETPAALGAVLDVHSHRSTVDRGSARSRKTEEPGNTIGAMLDQVDEDTTPLQEPKLSYVEATVVRLQQVQRERIDWLMAPECSDPPSLLELLERQAACRGMDVSMFVTERG